MQGWWIKQIQSRCLVSISTDTLTTGIHKFSYMLISTNQFDVHDKNIYNTTCKNATERFNWFESIFVNLTLTFIVMGIKNMIFSVDQEEQQKNKNKVSNEKKNT